MQYLTYILKRITVLLFMLVAENQAYAINDGNESQGKDQTEGATAMSPKLSFYDRSKIEKNYGVSLLKHDHNEINVEGVPLPPNLATFEYSLPSESVISIHVVSSNDDEVFNQNDNTNDDEDSDGMSDSWFSEFFVVITTNEEPADSPQSPASSGRQAVVGFMQTAPVDDSIDPDGKDGDLLVAPDWESLIAHLREWMVGSLIEHLNVDTDTRAYLSSMLYSEDESDKEECRKELITLLNRLMEDLPDSVRDTEEAAPTSEAVPESSPEPQSGCLCPDGVAENRATSMDR